MAGGVGEFRPERYAVAISALWYAIEAGAMAPGPLPPARARGYGTDGASVLHYQPTYDKAQHDAFRPARPGARRGARAPLRADRRHAQPRGAAEHGAVPRRAVRPDARRARRGAAAASRETPRPRGTPVTPAALPGLRA